MLRKITISLAFIAATFIANAQERTSTTLTDKEIREMTWVEAMQDYRVNFYTVVDKFNACPHHRLAFASAADLGS